MAILHILGQFAQGLLAENFPDFLLHHFEIKMNWTWVMILAFAKPHTASVEYFKPINNLNNTQ